MMIEKPDLQTENTLL